MRTDIRWERPAHRRHGKPQRERGCGKFRFRDKREAVDFLHFADNARHAAELDEDYGAATRLRVRRAYLCLKCHGYHVTSRAQTPTEQPA